MTTAGSVRPLEALVASFGDRVARDAFAPVARDMEPIVLAVTLIDGPSTYEIVLDLAVHLRSGVGPTSLMAQTIASIATAYGATGVIRRGTAIEDDEIY